ncbi:MAG TPA: NosD domain-containing protein [Burkholderiales bacterium]|nr:NosD domain-containing protein [Burkholderiales bacterium]
MAHLLRPSSWSAAFAIGFAMFAASAAPCAAQDQACQFEVSLPGSRTSTHKIDAPGIYCLTTDVNMAPSFTFGNAVEIEANNVLLDLNGHKIGGQGAGLGTMAIGIRALHRKNVTIKNGTIRGFFTGIDLTDESSAGHVVEGVRLDSNTRTGMALEGVGHIVRGNQIVNTGGTTALGPDADAIAINVQGSSGVRLLNNDVIGVAPTGTGVGRAIFLSGGAVDALIVENRITDADRGVEILGSGKFRDNLTVNVDNPFSGGTNVGGND